MIRLMAPDARLFGMRIWRKKLSDAEFVDKIRRSHRLARWYRYLMAVVGIGWVMMAGFMINVFLGLLQGQGGPAAQQNLVLLAFFTSIFAGATVGFSLTGVLHNSLMLLVEQRKDRLLVACWDALQLLLDEKNSLLEQEAPVVEADGSSLL